ncbi:phage major capsid protein [Sphingomonas sp. MMS24-J13]|uniref:phage major capsid protein n=1 Tax=Sphingomonas sp. MMS24-J13 TaxID=3238686 RepID=UPI0038510AA9
MKNRSLMVNAATARLLTLPPSCVFGPMSGAEAKRGRLMRDAENHGGGTGLTAEQIAEKIKASLNSVKSIADKALTEASKFGDMHVETKAAVDKALTQLNTLDELKNRITDLEQKATRPQGGGKDEFKSYGQQVAEHESIKSLSGNERNAVRIQLKAITTASGSAGGMIVSQRETDIVGMPKRTDIVLRDLLSVIPIDTGSVDYPKQTLRTNNAAPVAEAAAKPYSNYGWSRASATVRTIAHLAKLTRQALDDAPRLQAEVDAEMRYGLQLQEDAQILLGDGTGENLYGLMPQATSYALPSGASAPTTPIDKLRAALLQSVLALYPADAMVLNPVDWFNIETTKDAAGGYIFANPLAMAGPVLWGKPVASTQSMTVGSFLIGAFKVAATLYDRLTPEVLISSENVDDFEKNLLTMRCEERLALAVKRPAALTKGTF